MRSYFYLSAVLTISAVPVCAQTVQPKIKTQIDPKAVILLDKVAAHYKSLKSLKMVAQGSRTWDGETMPNHLTLFFERPNKIRVQGEADDMKGVFVADGKTIFLWDGLTNSAVKNAQNSRYTEPWRNLMTTTDFLIGSYMSGWLFGEHYLRPIQTDQILTDADTFEAGALPSTVVNGAPAQGVRFLATKAAQGKYPHYSSEQILWFRADGRLVKAQQVNQLGAKTSRGNVTVIEETDDAALPTSTWALKNKKAALSKEGGFFIETKMVAHSGFDAALPGETEVGGSKQDSRGARQRLLTVAAFQPWRGSQIGVARGPLINAPCIGRPHKRAPRPENSALLSGLQIQGTAISPLSATKKGVVGIGLRVKS